MSALLLRIHVEQHEKDIFFVGQELERVEVDKFKNSRGILIVAGQTG